MTIYLLILITSGVTMALLGAIVYLRNPNSALSRYFLLLCLSVVSWTAANYTIDNSHALNISLIAAHIAPAAAFNILYWMYLFCAEFGNSSDEKRIDRRLSFAIWLLGSAFSASSLVFNSVSQGKNIVNVGTGSGYLVYLVLLVVMLCAGLWRLISVKHKASAIEKSQINLILLGAVVTFGIAIINNGIVPFFIDDWPGVRLTSALALVLVGTISYAIIKHRLFDIKLVIARLLAYTLVIVVLGLVYGLVVFRVVDNFFPHTQSTVPQQIAYTVMAVFMAFTFQPVKHFFDHVTERIFFKDHYSSSTLLANLSRLISSTLDIRILTQSVLNELIATIHIQKAAIFIVIEGKLQLLTQQGYHEVNQLDTKVIAQFLTTQEIYTADGEDGELSQLMKKKEAAVIVPFANNQTVSGLIVLGNKQSGDVYTTQDLEVLEILGPELAVAIENALSYQQVSQFNETLRSEVNKATKELQAANEQLTRKNHQLEQLDKLKDEFISVTSHELRTPLTAIRGYLWMAMHAKRRDENFKQYMDRAYISSERLIGLVNDTLDISRIESGRVQLNPEPTKLPALTKQVVEELTPKALENQQKLTIKAASRLPQVMCDPDKIHQVLTNLIGNALKFTPPGGSITIQFYSDKKHLVTAITDTGPGISPEDQKRLFQKFSRLASTAGIPGTGLGLYLCQQFISLSKGKIWVDSQVGEGSTFFFSLPITEAKTAPSSTKPHIYHPI